jgi:transcriptional regulator with XRE-family HTH domain
MPRRRLTTVRALEHVLKALATTDPRSKVDGTSVKRLRGERGWTQEELAKRSKVSRPLIVMLEPPAQPGRRKKVRRTKVSQMTLVRLAVALGVPVTELLK